MKEEILKLRAEGYTYKQIVATLGCSKSTVSYYCGDGQKEKTNKRTRARRSKHSSVQKLERFREVHEQSTFVIKGTYKNPHRIFRDKIRRFEGDFSFEDFIEWLEEDPRCYLTGRELDLSSGSGYHFDHIVPRSKGGTSALDNLGLASPEANQAKSDLSVEEFIQLCIDVLLRFNIIEES